MVTASLRLLGVIEGWYRPSGLGEVLELGGLARLNKLYLPFLRAVGAGLDGELRLEETRFSWYVSNAVDVARALSGLDYTFFKFRRPVDHVSVDLDILINSRDVAAAVTRLKSLGFSVIINEPYTVTLSRRGFIVDLYTHPSFAWVVYMNGEDVLRDFAEDFEVGGHLVRGLSREAEVVVYAAHAVYKEHIILLIDCLTLWRWFSGRVIDIANVLGVKHSLDILASTCGEVIRGAEAPVRLGIATLARAYANKALSDPIFRGTSINILRYLLTRRDASRAVLSRLTRRSY